MDPPSKDTFNDETFSLCCTRNRQTSSDLISFPDFESSLNLIDFSSPRTSVLSNNKIFEDCDVGKESLGILQLDNLSVDQFSLLTPKKTSSECMSFNRQSIEMPSKIYVLPTSENSSCSPTQNLLNNAYLVTRSLNEGHIRLFSEPLENNRKLEKPFFWSTCKPLTTKISTHRQCGKLVFDDDDDLSNDSVFLAQHITEDCLNDGFLDSTPQPEFPDLNDSNTEAESCKKNTESVFKTISKMFPQNEEQPQIDLETRKSKEDGNNDMFQNLSEILNTTHMSDEQKTEGRKIVLHFAQLLNEKINSQDCEDSGHSSKIENDSSEKIEINLNDLNKEIKNLKLSLTESKNRLTKSLSQFKITPQKAEMKLSLTSGIASNNNKTTSPKLEIKSNSTLEMKSNTSLGMTLKSSLGTNINSKPANNGIKIKSKLGATGTTKGPLIAVIPVKDMKKCSTDSNGSYKVEKKRLSKKTSTPIMEPHLKPKATSTPFNVPAKIDSRRSLPISSNSTFNKTKISNFGVAKKSEKTDVKTQRASLQIEPLVVKNEFSKIQSQYKLMRRNSLSEGAGDNPPRIQRSNSLGKEVGMMSSIHKVRDNLIKAGVLGNSNVNVESSERKAVNYNETAKSFKLKKNKENIHH